VAGLQTPCHSPYKALNFDRKYQNNSEKKERDGGEEKGVRRWW
jgi:hypothetical protein